MTKATQFGISIAKIIITIDILVHLAKAQAIFVYNASDLTITHVTFFENLRQFPSIMLTGRHCMHHCYGKYVLFF